MPESIAVIGMSCRFPDSANDPEKYWELLSQGRDAWSKVPMTRWNEDAFYHPDPAMNGTTCHRGGYFLDQDLSAFEPSFFGISAEEAQAMDPQQRIQLEIAYEALENAGIPLEKIRGSKTAVYTAIFSRDYDRLMYKDTNLISKYHMVGTGDAILSNRISYAFDLRGPSMTIDTGCSGSLVALHQACQSLRIGESSLALVGASNLILSPDQLIPMSLSYFLNSSGRCYSFDNRGDGYGRGEGVAMVVLKRLDEALAARDNIRAIIRNTGVNQDGKTIKGITAPSARAQEELIRSVYADAGLDPRDTVYLEAHGTGTKLGDLAEFESTRNVFASDSRQGRFTMGSAKSNIGHLESASGIAALIKVVLMFERGFVPPNLNLQTLKPELDYDANNIKIPRTLEPLGSPLRCVHRASINGFGYGGTNGHVIVESASCLPTSHQIFSGFRHPARSQHVFSKEGCTRANNKGAEQTEANGIHSGSQCVLQRNGAFDEKSKQLHVNRPRDGITSKVNQSPRNSDHALLNGRAKGVGHLIILTANSENSLRLSLKDLYEWARNREITEEDLGSLSFTLCTHRSIFPWRTSFLIRRPSDLQPALSQTNVSISRSSNSPQAMFVFTGQGAQWTGMGQELLQAKSEFKSSLERSGAILQLFGASYNLIEELHRTASESRINESWLAQPTTTALQIALVDLLKEIGIKPSIVLGHSSGEIAAAYAAGSLSQHAALKVSYYRSFLSSISKKLTNIKGAMLAVGLSEVDTASYLAGLKHGLATVACINGPSSVTVSGDETAVCELQEILDAKSIFNRLLKVDTAYHSHHMQRVAKTYLQSMGDLKSEDAKVPFISSVTTKLKANKFDAHYWVQNLVSPVQFSEALVGAVGLGLTATSSLTGIEIGPNSSLLGPVRQTLAASGLSGAFKYVPTLVRNVNAVSCILETAGKLFEVGHAVDLRSAHSLDGREGSHLLLKDLPPYSWDRSNHYWHESRLSRDYRLRKHAYHDLLGVRVLGTIPSEPTWRNLISVDSHPWLVDHVIEKAVIFPASGYLCMATEALKQIAEEQGLYPRLSRFIFRDVSFLKALVIPEDQTQVEMLLSFRREEVTGDQNMIGWDHFRILTVTPNGTWSENCKGRVALELDEVGDGKEFECQRHWIDRNQVDLFHSIVNSCSQNRSLQSHYPECHSSGNVYGPTFSMLENLKITGHDALAKVRTPDIAAIMPYQHMSPHLIHPATLDSMLQLGLPLYYRICSKGPVMPVYVEEIIISWAHNSSPGTTHKMACNLRPTGPRSAISDIVAVQRGPQGQVKPTVIIRGQELRGLGTLLSSKDIERELSSRNMVSHLEWRPDISLSNFQEIAKIEKSNRINVGKLTSDEKDVLLEQVAILYMDSAIKDLTARSAPIPKQHHQKLMAWIRAYVESEYCQRPIETTNALEQNAMLSESRNLGIEGEALTRVGQLLPRVLTGEVEPLSILLQDNMLYRLYADESSTACNRHLQTYLEHLAFKQPYLKVLEIGAGTGETSLSLLQAHSVNSDLYFSRYDYTDISPGFFENARTRFQKWAGIMRFETLNIEKDPVSQGFEELSYDLIIAANVIHATSQIDTALKHVHQLLKPDGHFVLLEMVREHLPSMIVYGVLPGWWAGADDSRDNGPLLKTTHWASRLLANGLVCQTTIDDVAGRAHRSSLLISSKVPKAISSNLPTVHIIDDQEAGGICSMLATQILQHLKGKELPASICRWPSKAEIDDAIYIVIDTREKPIYMNSPHHFQDTSLLLTYASRVLWITGGLDETEALEGPCGLATGLIRTARSENSDLQAVLLTVESDIRSEICNVSSRACDIITKHYFNSELAEQDLDYVLRRGELLIPRLLPEPWITSSSNSEREQTTETISFHEGDYPLKLHVEKAGLLDTLSFFNDADTMDNDIEENEVQIQVHACGVNFKDVFIALGQMKATTDMAGECAGIVTQIGSNVPDSIQVGDRVCAANATPYASVARVHYLNTITIPESMSFTTAASIPIVFATAYEGLVNVARLQQGQTVLITAASGGVGQAAIQIAQHVGANIFAIVSSTTKRQLLIERFHLDPIQIFSSRSRHFKEGLMQLTQQQGVDVILNSTSGEMLANIWSCLAPFGTFVEIGKTDIYKKSRLDMRFFDGNTTFAAVDLSFMGKNRPARVNALLSEVMQMFKLGSLTPAYPLTIVEIGDVEKAFRMIQGRKHSGKIVLDARPGLKVKAAQSNAPILKLHSDGTYVITGGLGDLAGHISRSMAKRGAGNIVLLSRRTLKVADEKRLKGEFRAMGTDLYIMQADITSRDDLDKSIGFCKAHLPPIKGVVQGAMVLQDCLLANMEMDAFEVALKPKVDGTKNLLGAVRGIKLDFCLLLSSLASIFGPPGQSNYSAANSYLDYVAQLSRSSDLPIVAVNIGMLEDSQVIAQNQEIISNLLRSGYAPLKVQDFILLFEYLINPKTFPKSCKQVVLGANGTSLQGRLFMEKHAIFRALRNPTEPKPGNSTSHSFQDMKEINLPGMDARQVQDICLTVVKRKIATLLAIKDDDINHSLPVIELGMDSLIIIELKNWITGKFKASLVVSEITDATSLTALTSLVLSRSLLLKEQKDTGGQESAHDMEEVKPSTVGQESIESKQKIMADTSLPKSTDVVQEQQLPALPLPQLQETLDFFSSSVKHFCSESDAKQLQSEVDSFLAPGGIGQTLQSRLFARASDPKIKQWQNELYTNFVYLRVRAPVNPFQIFSSYFLESKPRHTQAERSAIMTLAASAFDRTLKRGLVPVDFLNDEPLDMMTLQWVFGSVREPHVGVDIPRKYDNHDYIVVLRKGHLFKVMLSGKDGREYGFAELRATFDDILSKSLDDLETVAVLTADERDSWAKIRSYIQNDIGDANRTVLETIEAATFAVCLDDAAPEGSTESANHFLLRGATNRWSDKVTQLIICSNGVCGMTFEHSMVDGSTIGQLNKVLGQAISTDVPTVNTSETLALYSHLQFNIDETVSREISRVRQRLENLALIYKCETQSLNLEGFGHRLFRRYGCSGKTGLQLTIQLAARFYFGADQPPSWETVTMRSFRGGRVDIAQTVQARVKEWCEVAASEHQDIFARAMASLWRNENYHETLNTVSIPTDRKSRACFLAAAREHVNNMARVSRGQGFAGHLYALQEVRNAPSVSMSSSFGPAHVGDEESGPENEDKNCPSLFAPGSTFWRTRPRKLMTDCSTRFYCDGLENQGGYVMPFQDSVYVHYDAQDELSRVFIKCPAGQLNLIMAALAAAVDVVKAVLRGDGLDGELVEIHD